MDTAIGHTRVSGHLMSVSTNQAPSQFACKGVVYNYTLIFPKLALYIAYEG